MLLILSEEQGNRGKICTMERTPCFVGAGLCSVVDPETNDKLICDAASDVATYSCTAEEWGCQRGLGKEEQKQSCSSESPCMSSAVYVLWYTKLLSNQFYL